MVFCEVSQNLKTYQGPEVTEFHTDLIKTEPQPNENERSILGVSSKKLTGLARTTTKDEGWV